MTSIPSGLVPTKITDLPEYGGSDASGYLPYVLGGILYKVAFDQIDSVGAVPSSRTITAGTGLTGGGDLSTNRSIAVAAGGIGPTQLEDTAVTPAAYGSASEVPVITVDQQGRITAASTTTVDDVNKAPLTRNLTAGAGLTGGGTLAADRTFAVDFEVSVPLSGGTADAGVSDTAARGDHVHPAVDLTDTTETQGVLPLGRGGTGDGLSAVAGAVVYSTGTKLEIGSAGTAGQVLMSQGTSSPIWATVSGTGTVTSVNASGGTTGLSFSGGPVTTAGTLTLAGTLAVANGGTGSTTAAGARVALLPSLTGNATKALVVNGAETDVQWIAQTTGTVTSVGVSGGTTGLTASGGPVTTSGTITLAGTLAVANGGTGSTTAAGARTALGLAIGTDVQAYSANLAAVAGLVSAADKLPYFTGSGTAAVTDFSAFGRTLVDDANAGAARTTLGAAASGANSDITSLSALSTALSVAQGGTGSTTAAAARVALLPSIAANNGKVLAVNSGATDVEWIVAGAGTVTSVNVSGGTTGLTASGGPVTASGTITLAGTLAAANGGTGQTTYAVGDILYASTTSALSKLAGVATGNALISGGVGVAPSWGKVGLTTHVSGTLPVANGGTGSTTAANARTALGAAASGANSDITSLSALSTALSVAQGGTGATTLTGILKGNGTSAFTAVTAPAGTIVGTTDTQTLTNKTLTAMVIDGGFSEEVAAMPALNIDPANGSIQTKTLTSNSTFTESLSSGQSVTLLIDDGSAYTITWPTIVWKTDSGAAPSLNTTGYTVIEVWKVSTTLYGARVGDN